MIFSLLLLAATCDCCGRAGKKSKARKRVILLAIRAAVVKVKIENKISDFRCAFQIAAFRA